MGWKAHAHQWPNGRPYWTVEDRTTRRARIGEKGGFTKYQVKSQAQREAQRMRDDDLAAIMAKNPAEDDGPDLIDDGDKF